ncbi:hypothetical protein BDR26DRAFT_805717, partial [Obelidium mucronatum]
SFGFDSHKRSNLYYLDEQTLLTSVGNVLVFINVKTSEQTYFEGLRDGAIGAIAVHPSRKYIALAEVYPQPSIFIFQYPSMNLFRILRGGTTRAYSDIAFNAKGDKLASVGSDPDYMLTVWNWKAQEITLKSKAFSQDVYKVAFAPENDGILTTSGMGHIKFWQMSATFTGLKLQGYLGKFGASELTDICSFIQLPDGKVLSSTETGNLLLWDGGMIKCEIAQKGKKPCHVGKIEVVLMVDSEVFTAGEDGYVRVWDFEMIDNADVTSETAGPGGAPVSSSGPAVARVFEMEFLEEFMIGKDVKIKNMIRSIENPSQYLILDMEGHLFKLDTKQRFIDKTLSFHSGGIAGLDMSTTCHSMVSLGSDGVVHLYDYMKKALLAKEKYTSGGTALASLPLCLDARGSTVAAGFTDGVLRIISYQPPPIDINRPVFTLQYAFKPHKCAIAAISISADGTYMATVGATDQTIFFFKIENKPVSPSDESSAGAPFDKNNTKIVPIGFIEMEEAVSQVSFSADNHTQNMEPNEEGDEDDSGDDDGDDGDDGDANGPLAGKLAFIVCKNGEVFSSRVPHPRRVNTSLTFQLEASALRIKPWKLNVPPPKIVEAPKPKEGAEEEKKEAPGSAGGDKKDAAAPAAAPQEAPKDDPKADKRIGSAIRKARGLCITGTSAISRILYLPGGYFLMALVNKYGEGEIRSCKFDSPDKSRLLLVGKNRFTDLKLSATGKYLISGTADGMTCIRQIKLDDMLLHKWEQGHETYEHYSKCFDDVAHAIKMQRGVPQGSGLPKDKIYDGQYWMGHVHDCDRGAITNVSLSFDEAFLCSSGMDGGIFMFRFNPKEINDKEAPNFEYYESDDQEPTSDIIDKNVYTIQETKIKSERDRQLSEAEQKKQATRDYISELCSEYLKITATMDAQKIPRNTIPAVDPDLKADIEKETLERIENVKKELEWVSEKESIGPNKLKRKYLDPIQTYHIRVTALKTAAAVATFRTLALTEKSDFGIHSLGNHDRAAAAAGAKGHHDAKVGTSQSEGAACLGGDQPEKGREVGGRSTVVKKQAKEPKDSRSKLEARKALRAERAQLWKQLMDAKPDANYEDRRDGCYPDERYVVTDKDIENLKREEAANANQSKRGGDGDFGGFGGGGGGGNASQPPVPTVVQPPAGENNAPGVTSGDPLDMTGSSRYSTLQKSRLYAQAMAGKSALEIAEEEALYKALECRRKAILRNVENHVKAFDVCVDELMHERVALEADVKLVDMKLLLLYREWVHLKEFEKHDNFLAQKLNGKSSEKLELAHKIKECQERLNAKKIEIEEIISSEKELQEEFGRLVAGGGGGGGAGGGENKHEEFLSKVLKKKIKRTKKKAKTDGDEEDEEEEEEEEDDEDDDDDEDFEDEGDENAEDLDTCPADLDPAIFEGVIQLRERKLDLDEALVEIQKAIEGFKKENDALLKKEKIIDAALRATESEIQDFQTQKQRKLNELDVVVPLRAHQIQYLDEQEVLPADLSQALIFVNSGLSKLKTRIKELQQEKLDIRKNHKELKKMHVSLIKSRKEKQLKLMELEGRATDVQLLKFGQTIDLEKLERMGINRSADELREKLTREDNKRLKELESCDREIKHLKDNLTDMTRQNTVLLENLVNLTEAHHTLEEALNLSQATVNAEYSGLQKKDILERNKLISLVQTQANEIDGLKKEIELLIRKPLRQPATMPRNANKVTGGYQRASGVKQTMSLMSPMQEEFGGGDGNDGVVAAFASEGGAAAAEGVVEPFGQNDVAGATGVDD